MRRARCLSRDTSRRGGDEPHTKFTHKKTHTHTHNRDPHIAVCFVVVVFWCLDDLKLRPQLWAVLHASRVPAPLRLRDRALSRKGKA